METKLSELAVRVLVSLIALAALIGGGYFWGSSSANDSWEIKWADRDSKDLKSQLTFTLEQRRLELERQAELDAIQKKADADLATANRNTANARLQSQRLQSGIDNALAQLRAGGRDTASLADSQARNKTGLLLAQLYREINDRSVELAGEADKSYIAGKQCEASYDALRLKQAAK